ncbi:hypothetical protein EDB92DRAFT_568786 [Lactarius akahatsu]|uniref:Uncharacterized protein n=1 Tax=Lactarius akahatsu TaxID=416441 RepID=A0AAD4LHI5_9AGAM|nr:hypothetical protein EDB92DRAFT_568786 [Lactarius akahatsu]
MAHFLRIAKSGSYWRWAELVAYNITIKWQDAATFFGVKTLPPPAVARELLTKSTADEMKNVVNYKLLRYMDLAMEPVRTGSAEESAVDDFAVHLLTLLDYAPRPKMASTRTDIPLKICGEIRHAKTDVCIVDSNNILLLIQEDKRHKEMKDPSPQLIPEAVATFQANDRMRKTRSRACIIPDFPTFYKIPITSQLADSVANGHYPTEPTVVHAHIPDIPRPAPCLSEGMRPLDNRRVILSCYTKHSRNS